MAAVATRAAAAAAAAAAAPLSLSLLRRAASTLSSVIATESGKTQLQGYLPHAFVVNGALVEGPILALPDAWLMWDVQYDGGSASGDASGGGATGGASGGPSHELACITPDSLAVLDLLDPPPEVLVVGCGAAMRPLPAALREFLRARNVAAEVLDTRNALSYFNFLNDEGRPVVGALLPAGGTHTGSMA